MRPQHPELHLTHLHLSTISGGAKRAPAAAGWDLRRLASGGASGPGKLLEKLACWLPGRPGWQGGLLRWHGASLEAPEASWSCQGHPGLPEDPGACGPTWAQARCRLVSEPAEE